MAEFNQAGHGAVIRYKLSAVTADEAHPFTMRELISASMAQLKIERETAPGMPAPVSAPVDKQ